MTDAPRLVASDLDGTLVRSDETVSSYSHEVLGRLKAAGIRIVAMNNGAESWTYIL